MSASRIHLIAPAGSCRPFFSVIGVGAAEELTDIVQNAVGGEYRVGADHTLLAADEDELRGGRVDDQLRAHDIQQALADDEVVAVVAVRGGAWFTRILPLIDFSVLERRRKPVAVFGFSEITPLINIVGAYEKGIGVYAMAPAFLTYGLMRYAANLAEADRRAGQSPREWMLSRVRPEFELFFQRVVAMIEGRDDDAPITARLVRGEVPDRFEAAFVGGNLAVLSTLIGSRFEHCIVGRRQWLLLEDFNDKPERKDRFLAHFTLAGYWERCAGVLLGDFHQDERDLTEAVIAMLEHHIPRDLATPVLATSDIGHTWPNSPLPLHLPLTVRRLDDENYSVTRPQTSLRTV